MIPKHKFPYERSKWNACRIVLKAMSKLENDRRDSVTVFVTQPLALSEKAANGI